MGRPEEASCSAETSELSHMKTFASDRSPSYPSRAPELTHGEVSSRSLAGGSMASGAIVNHDVDSAELLLNRNKAFEEFRKSYRRSEALGDASERMRILKVE